jgi:hypothetical protein
VKRSRKGATLKPGVSEFTWLIGSEGFCCSVLPMLCPTCGARALTALPPPELAKQPDDTTHVCHPAIGGCNIGFAIDNPAVKLMAAAFDPIALHPNTTPNEP